MECHKALYQVLCCFHFMKNFNGKQLYLLKSSIFTTYSVQKLVECILYDKTYKHEKHINIIVQMKEKKKSVRLDNCNALLAGCPLVINKINWFKLLQQKLLPKPKYHLIISVRSEKFKQHFHSRLFLKVTSEAAVIERWRSSKLD